MADLQELFLVENAMKPGSDIFQQCLDLLLTEPGGETADGKLPNPLENTGVNSKGKRWKTTLPFRGNFGDMEEFTRRYPAFKFAEKGCYQNGVASCGVIIANMLDVISIGSKAKRMTRSACFSYLCDYLRYIVGDSTDQPFDFYDGSSMYDVFKKSPYETVLMDHTTVNVPVDRWLTLCYHRGVKIVEGCFYYHPGAERGWDTKFSWSHLEVLHSAGELNIGPVDDACRKLTYSRAQYRTFVDPSCWTGHATKYLYEIYGFADGVATYRAVYVGNVSPETIRFNVPLCSSEDKIMITVNSELVNGTYAPIGKYFDQVVDLTKRDVAIEVSRSTYEACVSYLVTLSPNADIIGSSIRYIASRNYIDLVDGSKLVRMPALNYSDALAVSMVCALSSFQLRYELTYESTSIIQKAVNVAKYSNADSVTGLFSAIAMGVVNLVKSRVSGLVDRSLETVKNKLSSSSHIPGIIFDVYLERDYRVGSIYDIVSEIVPEMKFLESIDTDLDDPFVSFIAGDVKASAPEVVATDTSELTYPITGLHNLSGDYLKYVPRSLDDPVAALQEVYDDILPGHSTLDVQNVSEQKRVNDLNINTEFVGKISINKDAVAPENLYQDAPLRTAAIPQTKTSLSDLMLASSKRNWNKPDLQLVTDVWELADKFVSEFIDEAMIPGAKEILASKEADPTRFNALDYCDWLATRSETFRNTLMSSCPNEILEMNLEKYHTILKGRVKQKLSASAKFELPQGQVVVHHDSSTNALFTSVFRTAFNTLDSLLRKEFKSAGRISDTDFSKWLTSIKHLLESCEIIEIDSSKYDKSQGMLAQAIEIVMLRRLGIAPEVLELFQESFVGSVQSRNLGLAFIIAFQRKSGAADTMLGNIIYNYISAGRSVGYSRIKFITGKGDDNLVGVIAGNSDLVSQRMSYIFNLDARVIKNKVPYFSSGFIVPVADVVLFAPDPLKKIMLLGEIDARAGGSNFKLSDEEKRDRFQSFRDSVSVYTVPGIAEVLQSLMRQRYDAPTADVMLGIDALVRIAQDYTLYCRAVSF